MITCVLMISRLDYLSEVFESLNNLDKPKDTELLLIVDSIDKPLVDFIDKAIDNLNFSTIRVKYSGNVAPKDNIADRRFRISSLHNLAKLEIPDDCKYVYLHEDDTLAPPDTLTKLLKIFGVEDCAYAEGVEVGRHKSKYIGGWWADDVNNPEKIISVLTSDGIEPIDAGGFYCALVDADLYKAHTFEPFDTEGTNGLSCDVNFGLWLRRLGYGCYIDWSIQCDHISEKGSVNMGNTKIQQVVFERRRNKWTSRVE